MPKFPILKPNEVIHILEKLGFVEIRQKGSHKQFRSFDGRTTTVPFHKGKDISPILLKQILKDVGVEYEEFIQIRK
ncbi:MAG: type II toxin-antitoxin system HicA family toxin [Candidatus Kapabacteria bacterium]|nr:type II toxin-antitoxin system HicA family toxin [Candidatus Kapabacteria bacterium]